MTTEVCGACESRFSTEHAETPPEPAPPGPAPKRWWRPWLPYLIWAGGGTIYLTVVGGLVGAAGSVAFFGGAGLLWRHDLRKARTDQEGT